MEQSSFFEHFESGSNFNLSVPTGNVKIHPLLDALPLGNENEFLSGSYLIFCYDFVDNIQ